MSLPIIPSTGEIQLRGHVDAATRGIGTTNISLAGSSTGGFGMTFDSGGGPCEDMNDGTFLAPFSVGQAPYGMNELRGLSHNALDGPAP
tara:strand:+ start:230 stop:496 length:267 start_codon:yes stop_codon:yes gene_type:complete